MKPEVLRFCPMPRAGREGPDVDLGMLPISTAGRATLRPLITLGSGHITRGRRSTLPAPNVRTWASYRQQVIAQPGDHAVDWRIAAAHRLPPIPPGQAWGLSPSRGGAGRRPGHHPWRVTPVPDSLSEYQFAGLLRAGHPAGEHAGWARPGMPLQAPASRRCAGGTSRRREGWRRPRPMACPSRRWMATCMPGKGPYGDLAHRLLASRTGSRFSRSSASRPGRPGLPLPYTGKRLTSLRCWGWR